MATIYVPPVLRRFSRPQFIFCTAHSHLAAKVSVQLLPRSCKNFTISIHNHCFLQYLQVFRTLVSSIHDDRDCRRIGQFQRIIQGWVLRQSARPSCSIALKSRQVQNAVLQGRHSHTHLLKSVIVNFFHAFDLALRSLFYSDIVGILEA